MVFYDSDWNPAMDAQAQDRAHRIGQTRHVMVYRLVSQATVEENVLKKAEEKKAVVRVSVEEGGFHMGGLKKAGGETKEGGKGATGEQQGAGSGGDTHGLGAIRSAQEQAEKTGAPAFTGGDLRDIIGGGLGAAAVARGEAEEEAEEGLENKTNKRRERKNKKGAHIGEHEARQQGKGQEGKEDKDGADDDESEAEDEQDEE